MDPLTENNSVIVTPDIPQLRYDFDEYHEDFIEASHDALKPLAMNEKRPGKGVVMHTMSKPTDAEHILTDGLLSPRRYATLSSLPFLWNPSDDMNLFVYRTYTRYSREFTRDSYYGVVFREGLIGVPSENVKQKYPHLFEKQDKNTLLHGQQNNIWAYVPASHMIGRLQAKSWNAYKAFHQIHREATQQYLQGKIEERDIPLMLEQSEKLAIDITSTGTPSEFWKSLGAGISESALIVATHRCLNPDFVSTDDDFSLGDVSLGKLKTSYPWSKKIQSQFGQAINEVQAVLPDKREKVIDLLKTVIQLDSFVT